MAWTQTSDLRRLALSRLSLALLLSFGSPSWHYPEMSNVKLRLLCVIWPDNNPTPSRPINWSWNWNWPRLGLLNSLRDAAKFEYHHHILHEFDASQLVPRSQFEILEERLKKCTLRPQRTRRIWASLLTSHLQNFGLFRKCVYLIKLSTYLFSYPSGCDTYALSSIAESFYVDLDDNPPAL